MWSILTAFLQYTLLNLFEIILNKLFYTKILKRLLKTYSFFYQKYKKITILINSNSENVKKNEFKNEKKSIFLRNWRTLIFLKNWKKKKNYLNFLKNWKKNYNVKNPMDYTK